jgi:adenine phosphoribosyltransferase
VTRQLDLKDYVRAVPNFPQDGVLFRDITPLLQNAEAFEAAMTALCEYVGPKRPDAIVGIESRGFIFGAPIADRRGLPFVPIRKPGKLPAATMSVEYDLEYGSGQLDIHADALQPGQGAVIVDDLLATGGTAEGAARLVQMIGGKVLGMAFLIELAGLNGRAALKDFDIFALMEFA